MHTGARRLEEDEPAPSASVEPAPAPPLLDLQRSAGNAAVTRLLAREPAAFSPFAPAKPPNLFDPHAVDGMFADETAAQKVAFDYFDAQTKGGVTAKSIAELVHEAGQLTFKRQDGTEAKVIDKIKAPDLEEQLRGRAKHFGVTVPEHRDAADMAGVKSELEAVLANLGAIPTQLELGGDSAKVTASLSGKVNAEAKVGGAKVEVEGSSEGVEGSVTLPGGGKITGRGGPEGGGATIKAPGAEMGVDVTGKGIKATVKAGDLLTVNGSITRQADGSVAWLAEVSVGTIGKLIMPEDVAKVFVGAQETFSKSAGELVKHRDDPAKVKEHASALADAAKEVLEKAKKSASQKPGWRIGAELKGDTTGGLAGSITFTWVF